MYINFYISGGKEFKHLYYDTGLYHSFNDLIPYLKERVLSKWKTISLRYNNIGIAEYNEKYPMFTEILRSYIIQQLISDYCFMALATPSNIRNVMQIPIIQTFLEEYSQITLTSIPLEETTEYYFPVAISILIED